MKPFILIALLSIIVSTTACATAPANSCQIPQLNVNWWTIDSQLQALIDKQHDKKVLCSDKAAEGYAALSYDDILEIFTLIQMCRQCAGQIPTQSQSQNQQ